MVEDRYARQKTFTKIGVKGQKLLSRKKAVVVGVGATGSVTAELLVRAGVGHVKIIDKDIVELSNLQRQALYTEKDVESPKVTALKKHLQSINSEVTIESFAGNLDASSVDELKSDLILDCTDNMDARFLINEYAMKNNSSWIHSAAIQDKAELLVVVPGKTACFNCIFRNAKQGKTCEELGILNSASHLVSSIQAKEAIKILLGKEYEQDLLRIDVWNNKIEKIKVKQDSKCAVCRGEYSLLEAKSSSCGKEIKFTVSKCKTKAVIAVKPTCNIKLDLEKIRKSFKVLIDTSILLVIKEQDEIIVHGYGELLFKTMTDEKKIRQIAVKIYEEGIR